MKHKKKPRETEAPAAPPRRGFLNMLWLALGALALAEAVGLVIAFLRPGKPSAPPEGYGGLVMCGPVKDIPVKTVTAFQRGHFYLAIYTLLTQYCHFRFHVSRNVRCSNIFVKVKT